jgi:hypothetical protein
MAEFVKQITETIKYLSDRSGREDYIKFYPEDAELPEAKEVLKRVEEDKRYLKERSFWLWRLLDGYMKFRADEVWKEFLRQDAILLIRTLEVLFPPISYKIAYNTLTKRPQRLHPDELIRLSEYIIKHKDKVAEYGGEEPPTAKIVYSLELPDGTNTVLRIKNFSFDPVFILLHAYVYHVLVFVCPFLPRRKRKKKQKA